MRKEARILYISIIVLLLTGFGCITVSHLRLIERHHDYTYKAGQFDKLESYSKKFEARYLGIGQVDTVYTCNPGEE